MSVDDTRVSLVAATLGAAVGSDEAVPTTRLPIGIVSSNRPSPPPIELLIAKLPSVGCAVGPIAGDIVELMVGLTVGEMVGDVVGEDVGEVGLSVELLTVGNVVGILMPEREVGGDSDGD